MGYISLRAFLNFLISHGRQPQVKGLLFSKHAFHFARCLSSGRHRLIQISGTKPTLTWNREDPSSCRQLLINVPILYFCNMDKNLPGVIWPVQKKSYSVVTMRTSLLQYYFQPQPKTLLLQRNYQLEIRIKESTSFVVFSEHAGLHMNQSSTKSPSSVYNSSERTYYSLGCDEKMTFFCITQPVD